MVISSELIAESRIAVVIPCYKVKDHIMSVLDVIGPECDAIYVVDDNCPEGTGDFVSQQCRDDRVTVISSAENQGVGGATLLGYEKAVRQGAHVIIKIDGDGQMDPDYFSKLLRPILQEKADYAKGNRFLYTRQLRSMPLLRQVGNIGLSFLVKLASGYWNIFDPTNGFTAIRSSAYTSMDNSRIAKRYFFELSMLIELGLQRAVVHDVGIPAHYGSAESNLSEFNALIEFPPMLFWTSLRRILIQYFIRDFNVASLFLISGLTFSTFGFMWGLYHWIRSSSMGVLASTGTVMIAVLPIILGVQLLLQFVVMDIQNVPKEPISDLSVVLPKPGDQS